MGDKIKEMRKLFEKEINHMVEMMLKQAFKDGYQKALETKD